MTARIFLKLIAAVFCVLVVSLVVVDLMASRIAEQSYVDTLTRELADKCAMLRMSNVTPERIRALADGAGGRITIVAPDGSPVSDSEADVRKMENHKARPEIAAALAGRNGTSVRLSPTLGVPFLYMAVPHENGALRLAVPMRDINTQVDALRKQMLWATALAFLPAILIAAFFARYVSARLGTIIDFAGQLAQGNFSARLTRGGGDEFGVLTAKLNETGEKLEQMFDQLQREQSELERLERIRKDFVINVSHELRTPLASIQGYAETLLDGAIDDPHNNVRFLKIIRQNTERLTRLTADLLTLSRLELKSQKLNFASYYINALLENAVDSMKPLADKKDVRLQLERAPADGDGLPSEVFVDSEAMHQVLANLVDNALKYTPAGGQVTLAARRTNSSTGEMIEVSVSDTGVGIPSEDLPRLFERFYRVDKARSRELGGTGLGLAIVKHLTRSMGGEVGVESRPGEGSRFYFTVPCHDIGMLEQAAIQPELTAL